MITYGSYMRKNDSIGASSVRIVAADTFVAVLSGFMIIPVVVMFAAKTGAGRPAIDAGPGLMFVTLPRVFESLGTAGHWIGLVFFVLVLFAALTSSISMTEACVAAVCDLFRIGRSFSTALVAFWAVAAGSVSAFGYGRWKGFQPFGMPALEFFDFTMNSVLMPVVAALTCVFVGWIFTPKRIVEECLGSGRERLVRPFYVAMVKYFAPVLVLAILVSEICRFFGVGGWNI
jgi:NSS family neurotransmitter:Na+ symporter